MRVKFWGTRGSVPTPGRATEKYGGNTACVEVQHDGMRLILDAGTGIRELGLSMMNGPDSPVAMFFSHVHWDHIQGLPFFVPFFKPDYSFTIYAPTPFKASVEMVLYKQMAADVFPVDFGNLAAKIEFQDLSDEGGNIGPFTVSAFPLCHPGGSWAYRIEAGGRTLVYATDNEIDPEGMAEAYQSFLARLGKTDLLIADGQYTLAEYPEKRGWGHGVLEHLVRLAKDAALPRMAITHHDPMRDDDALSDLERRVRKELPDRQVFFARDGLAVEV
ncbi:MAG: MBL fold metallo-hydrolase [Polyangia bacterium]|jgi:phosphoribosyl 1,2-cyclic phosphodiesterase|nr:MBL fold metallo-hydrolase [Polyangia bacterium]